MNVPKDNINLDEHKTSSNSISNIFLEKFQSKKIFIGGLAPTVDEITLNEYFSKFGLVTDCIVMREKKTNKSRGFGFVIFASEKTVYEVIKFSHVSQHVLNGKQFECKVALTKQEIEVTPHNSSSQILDDIGFNYNNKQHLNYSNPNFFYSSREINPYIQNNINPDFNDLNSQMKNVNNNYIYNNSFFILSNGQSQKNYDEMSSEMNHPNTNNQIYNSTREINRFRFNNNINQNYTGYYDNQKNLNMNQGMNFNMNSNNGILNENMEYQMIQNENFNPQKNNQNNFNSYYNGSNGYKYNFQQIQTGNNNYNQNIMGNSYDKSHDYSRISNGISKTNQISQNFYNKEINLSSKEIDNSTCKFKELNLNHNQNKTSLNSNNVFLSQKLENIIKKQKQNLKQNAENQDINFFYSTRQINDLNQNLINSQPEQFNNYYSQNLNYYENNQNYNSSNLKHPTSNSYLTSSLIQPSTYTQKLSHFLSEKNVPTSKSLAGSLLEKVKHNKLDIIQENVNSCEINKKKILHKEVVDIKTESSSECNENKSNFDDLSDFDDKEYYFDPEIDNEAEAETDFDFKDNLRKVNDYKGLSNVSLSAMEDSEFFTKLMQDNLNKLNAEALKSKSFKSGSSKKK